MVESSKRKIEEHPFNFKNKTENKQFYWRTEKSQPQAQEGIQEGFLYQYDLIIK